MMIAEKAEKRVDSKVRFTHELYEDLRQVSHESRTSFQGIIDEALRIWMEVERGDRPEFAAGMAAAAMIFRDVVAEALRRQLPQKQMRGLKDILDRFIARAGTDSAPQLAEMVSAAAGPLRSDDPAVQYVLEVLAGDRAEPHEKQLAAYLRGLSSLL
jgi:hypothetical protein